MLLALTAGAQNFTVEKSPNPLGVQAPAFGAFKAPAKANLAANQLIVEGDFAPNSVQPLDLGTIKVGLGKTKNVKVTLRNFGSKLSNIDYTIALNGKAGAEQHLDFGKDFGVGGKHTVEIPFAAAPTTGEVPVTLTITKVNGEKNASTSNSASGTLITLSKAFKKVTVVEENTGTNCPWCSRGHVAMEKMRKLYGDQFVGIAWHYFENGDPMYFVNYSVPGLSYGSAPQAVVNRNSSAMDPYFNAISVVATTLDDLPVAEVKVTGTFAEEDTKVNAKASVESLVSGDYNIVYALVADGLTGTTNNWKQKNAYSKTYAGSNGANNKSDLPEDLQPLWDAGSTYFATFNDVLIASSYTKSKNNATLPTLVENGVVSSEYTLSMPTSTKIKSAIKHDKVYVVAMVLDKKGAIINAAKSLVTNSTGIENVNNSSEATVVARYNVNGVQIAAPVKGINIVKMSDGTTRKVLVK